MPYLTPADNEAILLQGSAAMLALANEEQTDGIDNANCLLAVMSVLLYTPENGLTVVG